jgi:hypothetical protein
MQRFADLIVTGVQAHRKARTQCSSVQGDAAWLRTCTRSIPTCRLRRVLRSPF